MMESIADNEYSTQYYGFSPEMFFREFTATVLDELSTTTQSFMKELSSSTCTPESKDKLIENYIRIHGIWSQQAEVVFQKLKPTIIEFFTIPKNVLLPADATHAKQYSEEEIKKLEEELQNLEEKYAKEINAIKVKKAEIAVLEKFEPVQKKVDEAMYVINQMEGTMNDVKELEKLAQAHKEYQKLIKSTEDDDDERSNELVLHQWKFKTG